MDKSYFKIGDLVVPYGKEGPLMIITAVTTRRPAKDYFAIRFYTCKWEEKGELQELTVPSYRIKRV